MKFQIIHSALLAATIGVLSGASMAADYKQNPFTLAYWPTKARLPKT